MTTAAATAPQETVVRLNAVGDVLLARGIERKIAQHGENYPLGAITPTLKNADLVIGNLECALSDRPYATTQEYRFRAAPARAKLLRRAGFRVMNLANNHALDCGREGLEDTKMALVGEGIGVCGIEGTDQPATFATPEGMRIGFLGFCDFPPAEPDARSPALSYATDTAVAAAVRSARKDCDLIVVSFHWGLEQHDLPSARQKHLARVAAKAGADLILGHHPHVLQGFEVLPSGRDNRRTLVAYSLGSFLYDGHKEPEKQSVILRCKLAKAGLQSAEIIPVSIVYSQPRKATSSESRTILALLQSLSAVLGTRLTRGQLELTLSPR